MTLMAGLMLLLASWTPAVVPAAGQDPWPALRLTPAESPSDSLVQAGLLLAPTPGGIDVTVAIEKPCQAAPRASYQVHGAVVKIRFQQSSGRAPCSTSGTPQAYRAHLSGLKSKRYQVIVFQADAKGRWQPWKAGVTTVP
jgi:hypothetical protein